MLEVREIRLKDHSLPVVFEAGAASRQAEPEEIYDWVSGAKEDLSATLQRYGAFMLRGFARLQGSEELERIAALLCRELMDYVGGTSPRRHVAGKVMTSTEIPGTSSIPLHQEMSYTARPPDKVLFLGCARAPKGGATLLADMRRVTQRLEGLRPRYESCGLRLRRALPSAEKTAKKAGVKKSWNEVFGTSERDKIAEIVAERGWHMQWLDDDFLLLDQELRPAYKVHPRTGEAVWFNQMHIFPPTALIDWAVRDGRLQEAERLRAAVAEAPQLMDQIVREDGSIVPDEDVRLVNQALLAEAVAVDWHAADLLVLDNTLAAHGRESFEGERLLLTVLGRDG